MAKRYKFKFLEKEVAQINNIFTKHGVALSFDEIKNYIDALEEIAPVIHKSYERYEKFLESKKGA